MAFNEYLDDLKSKKTDVNIFLSNRTMLTGKINSFDDVCLVLDKCLIFHEQIISIVPQKK